MFSTDESAAIRSEYVASGYYLARSLFDRSEVYTIREHFMRLRESGEFPGDMAGVDSMSDDPLLKYPRMIHMHRWDELAMDWLTCDRIRDVIRACIGSDPLAVQSMLYFKPAGARGQALHQDQHFVRVDPGEALAAWMALDEVDEENGCLQLVRGSHRLPLLCAERADTTKSFTDVGIALPDHLKPEPVVMSPGDVLFFHGHMIHGSYPNVSTDRFRRSLIGHYISANATKVADFYHPVLTMDRQEVTIEDNPGGGPCGTWVNVDGQPVVEVA